MKKIISGVVFLSMMLFLLPPVPFAQDGGGPPEKLTVITDFDSPPFSFRKRLDPDGFEVDIIEALAVRLGSELDWKEMTFDPKIFAKCLDTKVADAAICSMTITAERGDMLSFTRPYFVSGQAVAIGDKAEWKDGGVAEALRGKSLGAMDRTTGETYAREHFKGADIQTYHTGDSLARALQAGWVDAIILDEDLLAYLAAQHSFKIRIVARDLTREEYGIAVAKTNRSLLDRLNAALQKLDETGKYGEIYEKWFSHKAALPPAAPAGGK